jgi:predicted DNA-binding antitoxin AbrB/MazE fold protein
MADSDHLPSPIVVKMVFSYENGVFCYENGVFTYENGVF